MYIDMYTRKKKHFKKIKGHVGVSKTRKHMNKIGMVHQLNYAMHFSITSLHVHVHLEYKRSQGSYIYVGLLYGCG